jgi:exoribonuclease R
MSDADAQMLSNSAAKYVAGGSEPKTHYGFGGRQYAHTTSPIRRYADLYNQRLIKAYIAATASDRGSNQELVYKLNEVSRAARDFDRCTRFMSALEAKEPAEAIVIGQTADKVKIYVVPWKMSFKMNKVEHEFSLGSKITVNYHYDSSKVSWKERMIFQLV